MTPDTELRLAPEGATRWDWWPLARLLTVLSIFGALARNRIGSTFDLAQIAFLPRRTFEVFSFMTLVSSGLAHLYLLVLMFPHFDHPKFSLPLSRISRCWPTLLRRSWR